MDEKEVKIAVGYYKEIPNGLIHDEHDLNAWKIPAIKNDRDTIIILAYGDAGNMAYFLNQAAVLALDGYTVLLF